MACAVLRLLIERHKPLTRFTSLPCAGPIRIVFPDLPASAGPFRGSRKGQDQLENITTAIRDRLRLRTSSTLMLILQDVTPEKRPECIQQRLRRALR